MTRPGNSGEKAEGKPNTRDTRHQFKRLAIELLDRLMSKVAYGFARSAGPPDPGSHDSLH
jgi:hypothetical protein